MSIEEFGYKVVNKQNSGLWSCTPNGRILNYQIWESTYPFESDGPLAVFELLINAIYFQCMMKNTVLSDSTIEFLKKTISMEIYSPVIFECYFVRSTIAGLWVCGPAEKQLLPVNCPKGTVFASSIKLIKEV